MGLVSQVFDEARLKTLPGYAAVGHTRYSTTGSSHVVNAQPAIVTTRLGDFALAHNGNLVNTVALRSHLEAQGCTFETTTDSEMIALAIGKEVDQGKDWLNAALSAFTHCEGAYSLVIGTPEGVNGRARSPRHSPSSDWYSAVVNPIAMFSLRKPVAWISSVPNTYAALSRGNWFGLVKKAWPRSIGRRSPSVSFGVFEMIYFCSPSR